MYFSEFVRPWRFGMLMAALSLAPCTAAIGQTPWQSAPAKPAELPPVNTYSRTKVGSLPPPPKVAIGTTAPSQTTPTSPTTAVRSPDFVPLKQGQQTSGSQTTSPSSASTNQTGGSLIPDSLDIPAALSPAINSQVSNATPIGPQPFSGPPLPSMTDSRTAFNATLPSPSATQDAMTNLSALPLPAMGAVQSSAPLVNRFTTPSQAGSPPTHAATKAFGETAPVRQSAASQSATPAQLAVGNAVQSNKLISYSGEGASATPAEDFGNGQLVAVVGSEHILAGDMAQYVEPIIEQNRDRIQSPEQEQQLRTQVIRQVLKSYIELKALYLEFFHDMTGTATPDKVAEMKQQVTTKAAKIFWEKQIPVMLEKYDAKDERELEMKLREKSMSLNTMKTTFIEQVLSGELENKYVPTKYEIARDDLYKYYTEHQSDWAVPAKARWRQLTIRFDKHNNDRTEVERLIKRLGNQVYQGGQAFEFAAKQSSEGYSANEGGVYDWTTKGSLKSTAIDEAIFSIELGKLSRVISDDIGMHIVEVLERTESHVKNFAEAQAEIRDILSNERRSEEAEKFRAKVMKRTPVWTLWPEDIKDTVKHARPLSEAIGDPNE